MDNHLPLLLDKPAAGQFPAMVEDEINFISQSKKLFDLGFPDHALLDMWNAAVHNLRRRVESYGVEIFLSAIKDEPGRKKFNQDGDSLNERFSGIDDSLLIIGATRLGVIDKKAGKALEMINWMRNHASPAHGSDAQVEKEDVIAFAIQLQNNLFLKEMPERGHSPSGLLEAVKSAVLTQEQITLLSDQIRSFKNADIRVAFGFLLDRICQGKDPSYSNALSLFPEAWKNASDEMRASAGARYHSLLANPDSKDQYEEGVTHRLLDVLVKVEGIRFIPDGARSAVYKLAASNLAAAKDTAYGWSKEYSAAKSLQQLGPFVPSIAFEEVYQEILAVWCGNYWGRSTAYAQLTEFIRVLDSRKKMQLARMFLNNVRVKEEIGQSKPRNYAVKFLNELKAEVPLEANKAEIDEIIDTFS